MDLDWLWILLVIISGFCFWCIYRVVCSRSKKAVVNMDEKRRDSISQSADNAVEDEMINNWMVETNGIEMRTISTNDDQDIEGR